jgi:predicted nucleotidyltransferase
MILDLLLCTGPLTKIWAEREKVEMDGKMVKVVSKDGLVLMKKEASRPQDLVDIEKMTGDHDT